MSLFPQYWSEAPCDLYLPKDEVHVWLAHLDQRNLPKEDFWEILSDEEHLKAQRLRSRRDRTRFVSSHGVFRLILGHYLKIKPSDVHISCEVHGKPFIANIKKCTLQFNMAHSSDLALFAFSCDHRIGIDIERIQDLPEAEYIVEAFFTQDEKNALGQVRADQKLETFFRLWTLKEAYTKALGSGLSYKFDRCDPFAENNKNWTRKLFIPANCYQAAIVVEGQIKKFIHWKY